MRRRVPVLTLALALALPGTALTSAPAAATTAAGTTPVPTVTSLTWSSTPDDPIAQGSSGTVSDPGAFTAQLENDLVVVWVGNPDGPAWQVALGGPPDAVLAPGEYLRAHGLVQPTRGNWLDVEHDGRWCGSATGSFRIEQVQRSGSTVTGVELTFIQHCDGHGTLRGRLRYQIHPLSFAITSHPGDPIGQGKQRTWSNATAIFSGGDWGSGLMVSVYGLDGLWTITINPPDGVWRAGRWAGARAFSPGAAPSPQVSVSRGNTECETADGWLRIDAVEQRDTGAVDVLDATFAIRCEGASGDLHATLRYHL